LAHLSTSELAASLPPKGCSVMKKTHLREALYLLNHGIDEAVRVVQRQKKSPNLLVGTYHKSMAGLQRRRSSINLQFTLKMRKLEENDEESSFEEEFDAWLSDEPLTNEEICRSVRDVGRERKLEGNAPALHFLVRGKRLKKMRRKSEAQPSRRKLNGLPIADSGIKSTEPEGAHV
jgi:hypothetical protein